MRIKKLFQILTLVLGVVGIVWSLLSWSSATGTGRIGAWAATVRGFLRGPVQPGHSPGTDPAPALLVAFFFLLVVIAIFELREAIIPDAITIPGMAIPLLFAVATSRPVRPVLIGILVGLAIPLVIGWIGSALGKGPTFGWGVVKMLGMIGAFLGSAQVVATLVLAAFLSGLLVFLISFSPAEDPEKIEFGPALALSAGICAVFPVVEGYRALMGL
ncbi:MAG TPA: A24 family peptidase [Thermoanaerobaculia bacterium]|nr:A24 family peptidase [Thermoanaerobaculia bacterium]